MTVLSLCVCVCDLVSGRRGRSSRSHSPPDHHRGRPSSALPAGLVPPYSTYPGSGYAPFLPAVYPMQSPQMMVAPGPGYVPHPLAHSTPQLPTFQTPVPSNIENLNPANQQPVSAQSANQQDFPSGLSQAEPSMPTSEAGAASPANPHHLQSGSTSNLGAAAAISKSSPDLADAASEKARSISISREQNRQISLLLTELEAAKDLNKKVWGCV